MKNKKTVNDIDLNKIDISKYTEILPSGTEIYRVMIGNYNPIIPTGQAHRYTKNPYNVSIEEYQAVFRQGNSSLVGTSSVSASFQIQTAYKEALKGKTNQEAIGYTIVFSKDIAVINTIAICLDEGVDPTPKEESEFGHSFYGLKAQAIRCKSAQDSDKENIIIFPDNIPDYINIVTFKEI